MDDGPAFRSLVPFGDAIGAAHDYAKDRLGQVKQNAQRKLGRHIGGLLSNGLWQTYKAVNKPKKIESPLQMVANKKPVADSFLGKQRGL